MNFEQITTLAAESLFASNCLCHRKGNEFWANHNGRELFYLIHRIVFVTAKVMNFEQITTTRQLNNYELYCLCHRKGNEFWANHNYWSIWSYWVLIVFVTAKVMNFEQITTATNWINSSANCLCHRKGNEFWANHNRLLLVVCLWPIVFVTAKVMNFEQITTLHVTLVKTPSLSLSPQR